MKILYAIQGTGNGHMARAEDVVPLLQKHGEVDLFVSGAQADIRLPFPVKYTSKGLSFYFGKGGGIDLVKTFSRNSSKDVFREIRDFPAQAYDVIINDFEPISAWAARRKAVPCVALSHQSALLLPGVEKPKKFDPIGDWILRHYAPAHFHVGFHFDHFSQDVFTPVIRTRVREAGIQEKDHYTVYLPAFDDKKLVPLLSRFATTRWHIFSKHTRRPYEYGKISVFPINNEAFTNSMATGKGVLCGAGFETPAEALYLGKMLMVIPMKNQYEQHYNAAALKAMGVPVLKKLKRKKRYLKKIDAWLQSDHRVSVQYDDVTEAAVNAAVSRARFTLQAEVPCIPISVNKVGGWTRNLK